MMAGASGRTSAQRWFFVTPQSATNFRAHENLVQLTGIGLKAELAASQ